MRRAFAAGVAFAALVLFVALRFGMRPDARPPPPDAALALAPPSDAPPADAAMAVDAAPPTKPASKPGRKPTKPATKPTKPSSPTKPTKPPPVIVAPVLEPVFEPPVVPPVIPSPAGGCTPPPNPIGCPAAEPNVNRPCDTEGARCIYGRSCCPWVYVCANGAFEAWFSSCP